MCVCVCVYECIRSVCVFVVSWNALVFACNAKYVCQVAKAQNDTLAWDKEIGCDYDGISAMLKMEAHSIELARYVNLYFWLCEEKCSK